jgi:hypothetical protein
MLHDLSYFIPPTHGRAVGVGYAYVVSMGPQLHHRFGVSFDELPLRQVPLLDHLVKIIYPSHLVLTSIVEALSMNTLCDHPTLFTEVRGRQILRTSP